MVTASDFSARGLLSEIHPPRLTSAGGNQYPDLLTAIHDSAYMVRLTAVRRMPPELLPLVRHDPDPEVRQWVARRIDLRALPDMAFDTDSGVRRQVAERLAPQDLVLLRGDSDLGVRFTVAERIVEEELGQLLDDPEEMIRELARRRIAAVPSLARMLEPAAPRLRLIETEDSPPDPESRQ